MNQDHGGSPLVAAISLAAAAAGASAAWADGQAHQLVAAIPTPDQIVDYTKAVCNAVGIVVNTLVGAYHALRYGRQFIQGWRSRPRKRAKKRDTQHTPSAGPVTPTGPAALG